MTSSDNILKSKRVLLVDDEPCITELLSEYLEGHEMTCKIAASGNSAFELLRKSEFDLVISDIKMPNGDGIELAKKIKKYILPPPPIILISGYFTLSKDQLAQISVFSFLEKPVDLSLLIKNIENVFYEWV
jgi:CheY-like chemotaxis protein